MKILKMILLVIAIIIAIPLVLALFIKRDYSVQRDITINKSNTIVYDYVKYLKNQEQYSKWVMTDPAMRKQLSGTDGTVGFVYAWDSDNKQAGKGEQEITKLMEGKEVDTEVRFEKPMKGIASIKMFTEDIGNNQTKVSWGMTGKNNYPMNFMNLFMGNMLGKDLDVSLNNLKTILERK
ncbi:MAG: SRPBCC family protein [Bacteroidota bacterium]